MRSHPKTLAQTTLADRVFAKITIVYDNNAYISGWESGWGFSALIENKSGKRILFDTGGDSEKLFKNLERSGVDLRSLSAVALSHMHWDHIGGVNRILSENKKAFILVPEISPEIAGVQQRVVINKKKKELINDVWLTPVFNGVSGPDEAGVVVIYGRDSLLVTGCAHPGVLNMVKNVKRIFGVDVKTILGGFHLKKATAADTQSIIQELKNEGVEKFAPCHCTGERQIRLFSEMCGEGFIETGSGKRIIQAE